MSLEVGAQVEVNTANGVRYRGKLMGWSDYGIELGEMRLFLTWYYIRTITKERRDEVDVDIATH